MDPKRLLTTLAAATLALGLLAGCAGDGDEPDAAPSTAASEAAPEQAEALLTEHGLGEMTTVEIIDHLDRLPGPDRPQDLMASVRPDQLVLTADGQEHTLDIGGDRFYLSVAPYVDQTHECFFHSLTTCQGELVAEDVQVEVVDESGKVIVDEELTTFDNGFVGLWLPRDLEATLRITHDGRSAETPISTDDEAPTCLTTMQLA